MTQLKEITCNGWKPALSPQDQADATLAIESGDVLFLPALPFVLSESEKRFLSPDVVHPQSKNVSLNNAGHLRFAYPTFLAT